MRTLLRFGLGTLLFATLCVAGFFGGYRAGYERGAAEYVATQTTTEEYFVADLVTIHPKQEDIDFVTRTLRETVGEWSDWTDPSSNAAIEFDPEHLSLLVTHNQACHREIKAFLRTLRMGRSLDDPTAHTSSPTSPQQMVLLDVSDVLWQPKEKQPGFQHHSIQQALQTAVPKAQIWGIDDDARLRVYCNFAEAHQMRTVLTAMRELKYADRFQSWEKEGYTYLCDLHTRKTWRQKPEDNAWTLDQSSTVEALRRPTARLGTATEP